MKIWPAVDIRAGECVRLSRGDDRTQSVYGSCPADMANRWVGDGATAMHIVDLDAAMFGSDQSQNRKAIQEIIHQTEIPCQVAGGIRDVETMVGFLEMGAERVVIGTRAFDDPNWLAQVAADFPDRIAVTVDGRDGKVTTDGWSKVNNVSVTEFARRIDNPDLAALIYTDVGTAGVMTGPDFATLEQIQTLTDLPLIASGGVTTTEDIHILKAMRISGCIIGRALYEGRLTLPDAIAAAESNAAPPAVHS